MTRAGAVLVEPPPAARRYAEAALEVRGLLPVSKRAMTVRGVAQAQAIAAGRLVDAREVCGWFARHRFNVERAEATLGRSKAAAAASKAIGASWGWGHWPMYRAACEALARARRQGQVARAG